MPVPKRKLSRSRRDSKHANKHIIPKSPAHCTNCSEPVTPHCACEGCGFYKGRKIMAMTRTERTTKRSEIKAKESKDTGSQSGEVDVA